MVSMAKAERAGICDTFEQVGPHARTLCDGWDAAHLAAHLIIRETRPDLAAGMFLSLVEGRLERAIEDKATEPWEGLIEAVRTGPPAWSPAGFLSFVDDTMNTMEMFIHHEDVLRAQPEWSRRDLPEEHVEALWGALSRSSGFLYRRAPVGVVLVADPIGRHAVKQPDEGHGTVIVRGEVPELALFSYGRRQVAQVDLDGSAQDVEALRAARLSLP